LKLVDADAAGKIRAEDVIGKTRDWESGRVFSKLLVHRAKTVQDLSQETIDSLFKRAGAIASAKAHIDPLKPTDLNSQNSPIGARAFSEAADGIINMVPVDKPIVLLGRDAWPLVPILRARGRDAQYFMWSRLQNNDKNTREQWRKEVPPEAAVIDSGFSGSIINEIKKIDPDVKGYLMSSVTAQYPTLISSEHHQSLVEQIETLPKLIPRSGTHREWGAAIARKNSGTTDVDNLQPTEVRSRWKIELQSREMLRATGLSAWDVVRYSQFVGLTPQERLGLRTREQVEQHYKKIEDLRMQKKEEQHQRLASESGADNSFGAGASHGLQPHGTVPHANAHHGLEGADGETIWEFGS
jgi:hypothetical protein